MKDEFHDELANMNSFRHQVYIHSDDITKLPESLAIKYDNTDFRIFITHKTLTCNKSGYTSNFFIKEQKIHMFTTILHNNNTRGKFTI